MTEDQKAKLQAARDKLPDESKAAAILDELIADVTTQDTTGGGNGNGPPEGP